MFQTPVRKNLPNVVNICNNRTSVRKKGNMATLAQVQAPALRLTRRGRLMLSSLSFISILVVSSYLLIGLTSTDANASNSEALNNSSLIVVAPGETLWTIASRVNPERDPRAVIEDIKALNVLEGVNLYAGQVLRIPN
mgnify:FL=1